MTAFVPPPGGHRTVVSEFDGGGWRYALFDPDDDGEPISGWNGNYVSSDAAMAAAAREARARFLWKVPPLLGIYALTRGRRHSSGRNGAGIPDRMGGKRRDRRFASA